MNSTPPTHTLGQWILQLVTNRSWSGRRVTGPVLLLGGGWDNSVPCGFINLRAAIFKGLKDILSLLSLKTPALHNGGLFPCWGCDFIWRKCLKRGEGRGYFLVWGCHKSSGSPPWGTGSVPSNNHTGRAHSLPRLTPDQWHYQGRHGPPSSGGRTRALLGSS